MKGIQYFRSTIFLVLSLHKNISSDGLIIFPAPLPISTSESHSIDPIEIKVVERRRMTYDMFNPMGNRHRWDEVVLLSFLQQNDYISDFRSDRGQKSPSPISSTSLATAKADEMMEVKMNGKLFENDKVERILDANTIQLKKKGVVRLAGVRMPSVGGGGTNSNFQFPACFEYNPSYKVRQLLPKNTVVKIQIDDSASKNGIPQVVVIRDEDSLVVNEALVKTGFAVVKNGFAKQQSSRSLSNQLIIDADSLMDLQEAARSKGLGIFSKCKQENSNGVADANFVAEFEPLERSMETVYLSDGGKRQLRDETTKRTFSSENPPKNPGDTKGCSDFETYEDALKWYEIYEPYYGDVAKLDRDGDGVPCPGLPHTTIREQYRMKVPTASVGMK